MTTRGGTITIHITETGGAVLSCSGCGELRRTDDPERVASSIGALAKVHAGLHATAASKGLSFEFVQHLMEVSRR